jgi:transcriptional regulator with XRE-family HTH domain
VAASPIAVATRKSSPLPKSLPGWTGLVFYRAGRRSHNLSQNALGYASGYHRTYISQLERGKKSPSLRTIFNLATTLDVLPSKLIKKVERLVRSA